VSQVADKICQMCWNIADVSQQQATRCGSSNWKRALIYAHWM